MAESDNKPMVYSLPISKQTPAGDGAGSTSRALAISKNSLELMFALNILTLCGDGTAATPR